MFITMIMLRNDIICRAALFWMIVVSASNAELDNGDSQTSAASNQSTDCMQAFFQQSGVRRSHVTQYVANFRQNGIGPEVLFDLRFVDLASILQDTFGITYAGDTFSIHTCITGRGRCMVQPFCHNEGTCVYSDVTRQHHCKCKHKYTGPRCSKKVENPVEELRRKVKQMSVVLANVGVSYTRWGRNSCNSSSGAELVYAGQMAGSPHLQTGGGSNFICLPMHPQYDKYRSGAQANSYLYGSEFQTDGNYFLPFGGLYDQNPTCAVCHVTGRSSQIMIPGHMTCPPSWSREYHGYLMSAHNAHNGRTEFICVDGNPDVLRGESANTNGALLYFVEVNCGHGLDCPPFHADEELTCVVCSR
ncbi:uncharacterized protein LOC135822514 [Sycon ciliatum]|uniref:uncharacterized protein LOC135822514 n=1 Tax=Sycon ciliatum TaxID=27933 RepID=UPI0031F6CDBC